MLLAARPRLVALVGQIGEDAGLAVPDGHAVRYLDQVESGNAVQVRDWTGTRAPLHAVPSGLVLLAEWPAEALNAFLAGDLERVTGKTVVDPAAIRARLDRVRSEGSCWAFEEFAEGIASVAAPVREARGRPVAAVHVHGPAYRFPGEGREAAVAAAVAATAASVSRELVAASVA